MRRGSGKIRWDIKHLDLRRWSESYAEHWASAAPAFLSISVLDLFERMYAQSFAGILVSLRNQRVHGGEYKCLRLMGRG